MEVEGDFAKTQKTYYAVSVVLTRLILKWSVIDGDGGRCTQPRNSWLISQMMCVRETVVLDLGSYTVADTHRDTRCSLLDEIKLCAKVLSLPHSFILCFQGAELSRNYFKVVSNNSSPVLTSECLKV